MISDEAVKIRAEHEAFLATMAELRLRQRALLVEYRSALEGRKLSILKERLKGAVS